MSTAALNDNRKDDTLILGGAQTATLKVWGFD